MVMGILARASAGAKYVRDRRFHRPLPSGIVTMATTTKLPPALKTRRAAPLVTPTDLDREGTRDVAAALNRLLADTFALYLKTKNFHWHMSGPHFRDYHLLLDEQADQIYAMTDPLAERVRKLGRLTLHSIGEIARLQRVADNDAEYVEPLDMLAELREDNQALAERMREAHDVCDEGRDVASASLLEVWIDEAERRTWFLFEASRRERSGGH
jgi:starvation-inducible DNA-binding protein